MITRLFGRSHRQRDRDKQEYYRLKYERERRNVVPVKPPLKPTERKVVDPKRQVYDHPYYANPQYAVGGEQQWQQQGNRQQNDQQHEPKRQMRVKFADDVKKHDGGNVCKRSKDRKDADTMQKEGQGKGKGKGKETVQSKTDEGSSKTSEELKKGMKGPWHPYDSKRMESAQPQWAKNEVPFTYRECVDDHEWWNTDLQTKMELLERHKDNKSCLPTVLSKTYTTDRNYQWYKEEIEPEMERELAELNAKYAQAVNTVRDLEIYVEIQNTRVARNPADNQQWAILADMRNNLFLGQMEVQRLEKDKRTEKAGREDPVPAPP